jgi:PAT family beta-lactamase induction signal transducer AmpG
MSPLPDDQPKRSIGKALAAYGERQSLVMLALGFASGLPNLLIFDTLSAWLRDAGLSLEVIAFFGLATLAYSLKFLWAPLVDRTVIPVLTARLGHRRSWMIVCQVLIMLGLWLVAGANPVGGLGWMALLAVLVGFVSATQDIVIDAWRIEAAVIEKQGVLAAAYQWGYRIAMIVAGVVPLALSESLGWNTSYALMSILMVIGVFGVLGAPREAQRVIRAIPTDGIEAAPGRDLLEWLLRGLMFVAGALVLGSGLAGNAAILAAGIAPIAGPDAATGLTEAWAAKSTGIFLQLAGVLAGGAVIVLAALPLPNRKTLPGRYLGVALGEPLANFFGRYGRSAGLILALICLYRLSDFVLNIMNPFYLDLGFQKLQIAEVRKVLGVIMSIAGVGLAGFCIARFGLMRSLIIGAFAGSLSNLVFGWLAAVGPQLWALGVAISVDNIASGFAGTCLIAYMSSLTAEGFTATQYALFSSLYALLGKLIASQSGRIVEGAAAAAEASGPFAALRGLFTQLPPQAYAQAMEKSHVSSAALGSGYLVFFIYSAVIGMVGVALSFIVAGRAAKAEMTRT